MTTIEIKYQACNLCQAMHRNVNDNFQHVSFDVDNHGYVQVQIILSIQTEQEEDYIDDIMGEFLALQLSNCVLKAIVKVGQYPPLSNIVYQL